MASTFATLSTGASPNDHFHVLNSVPLMQVRDAVESGKLASEVARQLRKTGRAEAILILEYQDVLASAEAAAPDGDAAARARAILSATRPAYAAVKARVLARLPELKVLHDFNVLPLVLVRFSSEAVLLQTANDPEVLGIQDNGTMELALAQSLPLIRQPTAAAAGFTGSGTAVAVLDTGVDYTNPAFGNCTSPGVPTGCKVLVAQDFAPDDGQLDDNGHGTNVAGIVVGVAPSTKILALDVFGSSGFAADSYILAAINFAVANEATYNIRAMNLSLGIGHYTAVCSSSPYAAAFAGARSVGIMPVAAAGNAAYVNGSFVNGIDEPACAPGAMSVGAVYDSNVGSRQWSDCSDPSTTANKITCFSQSASFLTVLAPGALITAAGSTYAGTSQATPHVAGAVAVVAAANPAASLGAIASAIANSGPLIYDARNNASKHRFDLPDALTAIGTPTPSPTPSPPPPPPPSPGIELLGNPGFEEGRQAAPWTTTAGVINNSAHEPPHSGRWDAWLGGYGSVHVDEVYQQVLIPTGSPSATLTFWIHIDTRERGPVAFDKLRVQIRDTSNVVLRGLATYSNVNAARGYVQKSFSLTAFAGETIRIFLLGREDISNQTSFVVDDFALTAAQAVTVPAAPSNPAATAISPSQIRITWSDNSSNEAGFTIQDGSLPFVSVGPNTISYIQGGLAANSYHCFHIRSYNSAGVSAWTDWACATTTSSR